MQLELAVKCAKSGYSKSFISLSLPPELSWLCRLYN